jgi:predicted GNAT superfamily acetyltransferase
MTIDIRILETPMEMAEVEELQRLVWPGDDTEIVPVHIFRAVVHNGGLVIGAFNQEQLVGFVFGFPGFEITPGGPHLIHASHMAGVHPEFRDAGLGYRLKRSQWQMVRAQGIDKITWTYDPLQSRNANLNISKLGAVCNTYIPDYYGEMRDTINIGLPSDRFQVDWWVNSHRVKGRLTNVHNKKLTLSHYLNAGIPCANATQIDDAGLLVPLPLGSPVPQASMLLLEIPSDIQALKNANPDLAIAWSSHIRTLFPDLFKRGYLVTDFIFHHDPQPRSFYVLSHGEANL